MPARSAPRSIIGLVITAKEQLLQEEHPAGASTTREQAIDSLNEVFVVLAATRIRGIPTEVELGHGGGMPRDCLLNADHTDTIAKGYSPLGGALSAVPSKKEPSR